MAVRYGSLPFDDAIRFFRQKLNTPSTSWDDVWQNANNRAFMVAGVTKADMLNDFYTSVDKAISEGKSLGWFQNEFNNIKSRYGWEHNGESAWRSQLIYETNIRQAYNAGREGQIQTLKASRPYALYKHGDSETPRVLHLKWNNLVLPVDHPWWDTHSPQNGWGCKCKKFSLSERELKRRGLTVGTAPDEGNYTWTNKKTGEEFELPRGIDPGFDYTPKSTAQLTSQAKKQVADKPPLTQRVADYQASRIVPSAYSTAKNVTALKLDPLLAQLDSEVLNGLNSFLTAKQTKTLFVKSNEMSAGSKANAAIRSEVGEYLGVDDFYARMQYATRNPKRVGGFTSVGFEHVVVKVKASQNLAKVDMQAVQDTAALTVRLAANNAGKYTLNYNGQTLKRDHTISSTLNALDKNEAHAVVATWLHELGHQVHYYAGAPAFLKNALPVTYYGAANKYEEFAEAFTAWALARKELKKWQPDLVSWIDQLVKDAAKSQEKRR